MIKMGKWFALLIFAGMLSACVTTVDGPKRSKPNKQDALEAEVRLGMTYLQQGDRESAIRAFTKALEIDDDSAEAHQGMALIHQINGEYEEADDRFREALRSRADFSMASVQFSYGRFLYETDRPRDAIEYFEKASKDLTYGNRPTAIMYIGLCALEMGNEARAKASFEHALNLRTRLPRAAIELAEMAFAERDYPQAKKYLDWFVEANGRPTARSLWLGIRLERIFGNKDKEASYVLLLKNEHEYSKEYLEYKRMLEAEQ